MHNYSTQLQLYDSSGMRKYLNSEERRKFYQNALSMQSTEIQLFALMLFYSGARISEVLNLTKNRIDFTSRLVIVESLKKRQNGIFRQIPLSSKYMKKIYRYSQNLDDQEHLWKFSRRTGSRYIKKIMNESQIYGPQASAKGLRHGFAVHCVTCNIPLTLIKKWMGHSSMNTTAIYLDIVGLEERKFAERLWST